MGTTRCVPPAPEPPTRAIAAATGRGATRLVRITNLLHDCSANFRSGGRGTAFAGATTCGGCALLLRRLVYKRGGPDDERLGRHCQGQSLRREKNSPNALGGQRCHLKVLL